MTDSAPPAEGVTTPPTDEPSPEKSSIDPIAPMCACGHTRASHTADGCFGCAGPSCDPPAWAKSFANHVLADWHAAMDAFFNAVDRKRRHCDLTGKQVREALSRGYGPETADEWDEWFGDGDSDDD